MAGGWSARKKIVRDGPDALQKGRNPMDERDFKPDTGLDSEPAVPKEPAGASCPCCSGRRRERSPEEYRALQNRLSRIEGQVRGIGRMLEEDAYCPEILTQVSAVNAALNAFSRELLSQHVRTCVKDDLLAGREETVDELMDTLRKLMK